LKAALRGADVAARYGGEEFSILLPQTTIKEGLIIAERIRKKVEKNPFPNRQVTISIGIATCSGEIKTVSDLMKAADKALYQAKEKGRNNVQVYQESKD
jgi:diguanylate cyclase (GGDEF)-like protein